MFPFASIHCYQLTHLLYPTCPLEVIIWRNHCSLREHLTNMKSAVNIFFYHFILISFIFFPFIQRWSYMKARDCILLWFFSMEMWTYTLSYSEKRNISKCLDSGGIQLKLLLPSGFVFIYKVFDLVSNFIPRYLKILFHKIHKLCRPRISQFSLKR